MILKTLICIYLILFGWYANPHSRIAPYWWLIPFQPIYIMAIAPLLLVWEFIKIAYKSWDLEYLYYYYFNKEKLILNKQNLYDLKYRTVPFIQEKSKGLKRKYKLWLASKIIEINKLAGIDR